MAKKKNKLDVDFIGGQGKLTGTEEKALSDYFQRTKSKSTVRPKVKTKAENKRKHLTV